MLVGKPLLSKSCLGRGDVSEGIWNRSYIQFALFFHF